MNHKTQTANVLKYLKAGHRLSQSDAEAWWGIKRLAARVYDLKQAGHDIVPTACNVEGSRFTSYALEVK